MLSHRLELFIKEQIEGLEFVNVLVRVQWNSLKLVSEQSVQLCSPSNGYISPKL